MRFSGNCVSSVSEMASYAAVISLTHTIEHLSDSHHISVVRNSSPEIITFAYEELLALKEILLLLDDRISIGKVYSIARSVKALEAFKSHLSNQFHSEYQIIQFADTHLSPLQKFLQDSIISKGVNVLDRQLIREALRKLEDVIEPLASKFRKSLLVPIDMEEHINSFAEMVMNIKEYSREEQLAEEDDAVSREFRKLDHLLTGRVFADKALEEILQRLKRYRSSSSREKLNALEGQIREAACKLEDALEAHLSNQFLLQSDQSHPSSISVDLQEVNQDIDSFTQFVKKLKEEYISELFNPLPEDDNDDDDDDVLDTITIRFYEFPLELLKLVHLRYLAFTYDGKIPASISKLWNLQFLIVHPYVSVKSSKAPSYLPVEIWDMKELKYLQIMGSNLPEPCGAILPNLLTLLDVSPHSCTKGVLEGLPNLMKLGIQIELAPDVDEALSCFDHISYLYALESLKCVVVNPEIRHEVVAPPAPLSIFPSLLKKLSLSGFGYLWEDTHIFASLPSLEELKLRCYAFRGQKWETEDVGFLGLKVLTIEDTDLVHWTVGRGSFRSLRCLSLKHCYKLEQIPREFCYFLSEIELVDCNPLAVACAKQMGKQSHVLNEGDFEMKHIDKVGAHTFNMAIAPFSLSTFGDGTDTV
ncbi:hypothetical protein DH2020_012936 [Rehmannia glutinosa]|uniref:Disease resistance R13L4/SHOC-2-like LRR domain-containing protein n=1 Tax=Rehmannia glutinosa TaxID=99300 RepID=A0ABR0X3X8_REHGL